MGRKELYPVKKILRLSQDQADQIEAWRRSQDPIPAWSDAVRAIIEVGLPEPEDAFGEGEE